MDHSRRDIVVSAGAVCGVAAGRLTPVGRVWQHPPSGALVPFEHPCVRAREREREHFLLLGNLTHSRGASKRNTLSPREKIQEKEEEEEKKQHPTQYQNRRAKLCIST